MLSYIIYSEFLKNCHVLEEVIEKFWNQSKTVRLLSSRKEWFLPLRLRNTTGPKTVVCGTLDVNCEGMEKFVMTDNRLRAVRKEIYLARLSNEKGWNPGRHEYVALWHKERSQRKITKEIKVRRQDKKFFFLTWRKFCLACRNASVSHNE